MAPSCQKKTSRRTRKKEVWDSISSKGRQIFPLKRTPKKRSCLVKQWPTGQGQGWLPSRKNTSLLREEWTSIFFARKAPDARLPNFAIQKYLSTFFSKVSHQRCFDIFHDSF